MAQAVSRWRSGLLAKLGRSTLSNNRSAAISLHSAGVGLAICENQDPATLQLSHHACHSLTEWPTQIAKLVREHNLARCPVDLVLSRQQYQLLQLERPANIPLEELAGALLWTARDLLSEPPEGLIADVFENPAAADPRINLITASRELLQPLVNSLAPALPRTITIEELVLRNLVPVSDEAVMLVTQEPGEEPLLTIVRDAKMYVSRQLRGLSDLADNPAVHRVDQLGLEMQRSMDYFESQLRQKPVSRILLATAVSDQAALISQLDQLFVASVSSLLDTCQQHWGLQSLPKEHLLALGGLLESGGLVAAQDLIQNQSQAIVPANRGVSHG